MFAISPTDENWFHFLKGTEQNSYVNFWTPTPWNIKSDSFDRWYFLLKSPIREVAGFGEFVAYRNLTANQAWDEFGQRNGCFDKAQLIKRIEKYKKKNSAKFSGDDASEGNSIIGCIVLKNCEFWDAEEYKKPRKYEIEFPNQIVTFKTFAKEDPFKIDELSKGENGFKLLDVERDMNRREISERIGQGIFKGRLLKAYNNSCCVTGESCPELLEAAHIQKYLNSDSNHVQNGILLRVDLHRLFDSGLLMIDEEYKIHISTRMKGSEYYKLNGSKILLPNRIFDHPCKEALAEKMKNFRI